MSGPSAAPPEAVDFSSFRVDRRSGQLTRGGEPIPLRPKTWAVLLYLTERPGTLVSRDELLDAVWPDVAVTPDTLTKSIGELRAALGEDARAPRHIETVHGRGFRFRDAAPPAASGAAAAPRASGRAGAAPLVGREAELARLAGHFAAAAAGERQLVFLNGPAGVGKSTVIDAFLATPALRAQWVGRAGCVEQHGPREPYMPVLEALGRLAHRPDAARLIALLHKTAPTWLAQMPWLLGDDEAALRRSLQAARPTRMLREFGALVEALSADAPLVLVLEDLHWCDPATVDLLLLLGQRHEAARLLVLASYRPAEVAVHQHALSQALRTLQVRRQCVRLPLHEFDAADVGRYLAVRFPGAAPPPTLAARLHAHTDGNPLFVAAVVEHMLARGWILDTAPGWAFGPDADGADLGVPDDARHLIATQVESLGPADRTLLGAASVCGTTFAAPVIAAALREPLEDVERRCDELARARRLLRAADSAAWPDGTTALRYAFPHDLYRQAVYEGLSAGSRQRLHQRVGEALEAAHGAQATDLAAELAGHFEHAGVAPRALHYLTAAAARARQRFAGREAIAYLELAAVVATRLRDAGERQRQELVVRLALAPLLNDYFGFASDELRQSCERADALSRAVGTPAQRFEVLYALCHVHAARADAALLPAPMAELAALAETLGSVAARQMATALALRTAAHTGHFAAACELAEGPILAPLIAAGVSPRAPDYGADPAVFCTSHHALALWFLGRTEEAHARVHDALAASRRPGVSAFTACAALGIAALVEMLCGRPDAVQDLAHQMTVLNAEHEFRWWAALGLALSGWARLQHGEIEAGLAMLEGARADHAATGARLFSTYIFAFLAEGHQRAGARAAGLAAVDEGLAIAAQSLDRSYEPELWRLKGELLLPADAAEGRRCLQRAVDAARASGAVALERRATASLARA